MNNSVTHKVEPSQGKVIVLNGTSSSGKSTLAKKIQSISTDVYLHLTLDMFWDMTPVQIPASSKHFPNMKKAMAKAAKGLSDTGHNVIIDIIFCGKKTQQEFVDELGSVNLFFIKVECPISELKRRESERGDRALGLAESQLANTHMGVRYDLELNTSTEDKKQQVEKILNLFN